MQSNIQYFSNFDELPTSYDTLFLANAETSFCLTKDWFEVLANHTLQGGARIQILGLETNDACCGLDSRFGNRLVDTQ